MPSDFRFDPFLYALPKFEFARVAPERSGISVYYVGSVWSSELNGVLKRKARLESTWEVR